MKITRTHFALMALIVIMSLIVLGSANVIPR